MSKYKSIKYFRCCNCDFIQTENPYWLHEAYEHEKSELDVGVVYRNIFLSNQVEKFISKYYNNGVSFLDFAGGSGLFVRLMRDKGYNFFWKDKYCKNTFARFFEFDRQIPVEKIDLVTAFEVLEHFADPMEELSDILKISPNMLFSTELIPDNIELEKWWYFVPEGGQHIAFYNKKTLEYIAKRFHLNFYTNGSNLHLFCEHEFIRNPLKETSIGKITLFINRFQNKFFSQWKNRRPSLLQNDFEYVKSRMTEI